MFSLSLFLSHPHILVVLLATTFLDGNASLKHQQSFVFLKLYLSSLCLAHKNTIRQQYNLINSIHRRGRGFWLQVERERIKKKTNASYLITIGLKEEFMKDKGDLFLGDNICLSLVESYYASLQLASSLNVGLCPPRILEIKTINFLTK